MVFTPHILVGAAIGFRTGNIWLALLLSLMSHFFLDMLPHWEYPAAIVKKPIHAVWLLCDELLGLFIVLFLLWPHLFPLNHRTIVIAGSIFFAQLPDLFLFLEFNFRTKWTRPLVKMHRKIHNKKQYGFWQGLPIALAVVALAVLLMI